MPSLVPLPAAGSALCCVSLRGSYCTSLHTSSEAHRNSHPQPAEHRSRLFPKGSKASPKIKGPQAGQSTFIFSYKEKVFQGTFSEQEPPPKQEGSCREGAVGYRQLRAALSCTQRAPRTGAHLQPLGQSQHSRAQSAQRIAALYVLCLYLSGNREVPHQREL